MKMLVICALVVGLVGCSKSSSDSASASSGDSAADTAPLEGKWNCRMVTLPEEVEPGVRMTMSVTTETEYLVNGKSNGTGDIKFIFDVGEEGRLEGVFGASFATSYEIVKGKLCETVVDVVLVPKDDEAREIEKNLKESTGKGFQQLIPKGSSECHDYRIDDDTLVVTGDMQEGQGDMTCERVR